MFSRIVPIRREWFVRFTYALILMSFFPCGHTHPKPGRPRLTAMAALQSPRVDGVLDEPAWELAEHSNVFVQKFPQSSQPPSEPTNVRVLYDQRTIYIGIACTQERSPIIARLARRDQQVESDWVQVNIDTKGTGTHALQFTVNAAGVMSDGIRFNDTEYAAEWDEIWDARVARTAHGWSAEVAIPLLALEFSSKPEQRWGFQVRRYTSQTRELDEWAFIPRTTAGEVSNYGSLTGLWGLRHTNPISVSPFMIGRASLMDLPPSGARGSAPDFRLTAGLDLKWHINRGLTLSVALNPDLAQLEADQLIANITTLEIYLPEKRVFFLQGFDVFQTPMKAFYSRRIGMAPQGTAVLSAPPTGERIITPPAPAMLYGAIKLAGDLGPRLTIGLLSTLTSGSDAQVATQAGPIARPVEPLTLYNLLRLRLAVAENTSVGLLVSSLHRFEPTKDYPLFRSKDTTYALCPSGIPAEPGTRCFSDHYLVSMDGTWRSRGGDYLINGQVIATSLRNGPPRVLQDGTVVTSGGLSPGGRVYLGKDGGQWLGFFEFEGMSRSIDYNDIGYMQRQNQLKVYTGLAYRTITPLFGNRVQETSTHINFSWRDTVDGLPLWRGVYLGTEWRFTNLWNVAWEVYFYDRRFDDREIGDGTALQHERLFGCDFSLSTDPRRKIAAALSSETLLLFNGFSLTINAGLTFQILPQLQITILPQALYTFGEPRFIQASAQTSEYLFGRLQAQSLGAILRASYVFTPRLTLQAYSQLFLFAKHYSDFASYVADKQIGNKHAAITLDALKPTSQPQESPDSAEAVLNVNVVLRWEFLLGSTLYLLYARSHTPTSVLQDGIARLDLGALRSGPAVDSLLLKFSYQIN